MTLKIDDDLEFLTDHCLAHGKTFQIKSQKLLKFCARDKRGQKFLKIIQF